MEDLGNLSANYWLSSDVEKFCDLMEVSFRRRQLPKMFSKMFVSLKSKSSCGSSKKVEVGNEILATFSSLIEKLAVGQLLELWRTLLYQLADKEAVVEVIEATDKLMPCFLRHACLAEQSLPQPTVEKVQNLIGLTLEAAAENEAVLTSLASFCLLIKATQGKQVPDALKRHVESNSVLKRKLDSLTIIEAKKRPKLEAGQEMLASARHIVSSQEYLSNQQLESDIGYLVWAAVERMGEANEAVKKVMRPILSHKDWPVLPEDQQEVLIGQAAEKLLLSSRSPTKSKSGRPMKLWLGLPMEHLQGQDDLLVSLGLMAFIFNSHPGMEGRDQAIQALARITDATFRSTRVLRYLDAGQVLMSLASVEATSGDLYYILTAINSLGKLAVTYSKTLEDLSSGQDILGQPLASLKCHKQMEPAIVLLENLASKEFKVQRHDLFLSLSKALKEGLDKHGRPFPGDGDDRVTLSITRGLVAIINYLAVHKKEDLLVWSQYNAQFVASSLEKRFQEPACRNFLATLLKHHKLITPPETFAASIWASIRTSKEDQDLLIQDLITMASSSDLKTFQTLMEDMRLLTLERSNEKNEMPLYMWQVLAKTNLNNDEDLEEARKKAMEAILPTLFASHKQKGALTEDDLRKYYLPAFSLASAILEAEKPLVHREMEAAVCLTHCLGLRLNSPLLQDNPDLFSLAWRSIYSVISAAFHKRPSSLVVPRIPLVLAGLRNLIYGLASASDQQNKKDLTGQELRELVLLAHYTDRLCEHVRKLHKDFGRVVAFLVADLLEAFQKATVYPAVKANLLSGLHKLLDICDVHSKDFLLGVVGPGKQELFKHIVANYKQYFKYSGKV